MTISVQIYCCWGDKVTVSFVVKVRDAVHINVYNYVKWKLHTICDEEAASVFCQFTYWLLAVAVMSQEAVTCTILSEWFTVGIVVSVKVLLSPWCCSDYSTLAVFPLWNHIHHSLPHLQAVSHGPLCCHPCAINVIFFIKSSLIAPMMMYCEVCVCVRACSMDKLHMALTELCFAINYCSVITVWEHGFVPRDFFTQHLELRFNKYHTLTH